MIAHIGKWYISSFTLLAYPFVGYAFTTEYRLQKAIVDLSEDLMHFAALAISFAIRKRRASFFVRIAGQVPFL